MRELEGKFPNNCRVICMTNDYNCYGFAKNGLYFCLGEVVDMPGHYIFVNETKHVVCGLHGDDFRRLKEDE